MIVYAETNFIQELAFEQDQHKAANRILQSASLFPQSHAVVERDQLYKLLKQTLDQLKRSASEQRIKAELASYNCKYIKVFEHGLSAIESKLRRSE
jgi:hypothetical protein